MSNLRDSIWEIQVKAFVFERGVPKLIVIYFRRLQGVTQVFFVRIWTPTASFATISARGLKFIGEMLDEEIRHQK